jgi:signal transduction histidine kinase
MLPRRLRTRLLLSYVAVIAVGAAALALTIRLLGPSLFQQRLGPQAGRGSGFRIGASENAALGADFTGALTTSLWVALALSLAAGGALALLVSRRILRPLEAVRQATRRLAAGHFEERVPLPREEELAGLAADVNLLAANLAGSEARRTRLLGEVAHELRTPLATIEGHAEGLIDGVFSPAEAYAVIASETARLRRLVADLSLLSRADEGRLEMHPVPSDLAAVAGEVVRRLSPQFEGKGVELGLAPAPPLPASIDPDRVTQVLTNLVGNALAYTPPGGRVTVACSRQGEWSEVAVADSGRGLAPTDLERVFERFYRVRDPEHPTGGTGVGLTIARSIARAHGGDLAAASPGPGRGATFTLRIPAAPAGPSTAPRCAGVGGEDRVGGGR